MNIGTTSNGATNESGGVITASVNSANYIWGDNDALRYVYKGSLSGNVTMIARVDNFSGTGDAEAGIMIRKSTATNSFNYGIFVAADGTIKATYRNVMWTIQDYSASGSAPRWLKLEKSGTTVTAFISTNGTSWTNVASENMSTTLSDTFTAGLAVSSGNINNNASASFSNVTWPNGGSSRMMADDEDVMVSNQDFESGEHGFTVCQNYPNPFLHSTEISYQMADPGDVEFIVFDIAGRVIWSMSKQNQSAGHHTIKWQAENHERQIVGGIYVYQIKLTTATGSFVARRKMVAQH